MAKYLRYFGLVVFVTLSMASSAYALTYTKHVAGQDLSWPNCGSYKFNPAAFGIVGVNGGLDFHSNPCLGSEAALYKQNLSLYLNTGFPGYPYDLRYKSWPLNCSVTNVSCLAYNYGYNAGMFASNYALSRGVVSNSWWLDVETDNSWLNDTAYNKNSLIGEVDALNQSVRPSLIGFYSYPADWTIITGGWRDRIAPNWIATNSNYKSVAENQCSGYSFTGGVTLMTQYVGKLDLDLAC